MVLLRAVVTFGSLAAIYYGAGNVVPMPLVVLEDLPAHAQAGTKAAGLLVAAEDSSLAVCLLESIPRMGLHCLLLWTKCR